VEIKKDEALSESYLSSKGMKQHLSAFSQTAYLIQERIKRQKLSAAYKGKYG